MRIFSDLRFILFKDRSFFWSYMYIAGRRLVYYAPIIPIMVPLFIIAMIGAFLTWIGDFLYDTILDTFGGCVRWCLKKSKFWDFDVRTDKKFDELLTSAREKHVPK